MLSPASQEMLFCSVVETEGVLSLAAEVQLAENSHPGSERKNRTLALGFAALKSQKTQWGSWQISGETAAGPTVYLYDGKNLIEELDSAGNLLAKYSQDLGIDQPLAELRSSTTSYYQVDGLGSISSLSSSAGALANTYTYNSFGNLSASTGTVTNPFRYTGREFDTETGLYFYRARYYNATVGRFLAEDPLRFEIAPNFYPYVANDPTGHIDPSGLCPCKFHRVKLYYSPDYSGPGHPDYHWYRQDSNGGWSSKHGWAPVGNQVDPDQDAAASGYGVFCANMCAPDQNGTPPQFAPMVESWNDPYHIETNNCYSYACDRLHPPTPGHRGKPQPGGGLPANFTCIGVMNAAQSDGLTLDFDVR
jgi:RHS repeat-associated protein